VNDFHAGAASINEHDNHKQQIERHADSQMALLAFVSEVMGKWGRPERGGSFLGVV
jgi:hypothetical protein